MSMLRRAVLHVAVLASLAACAPMTFSKQAEIDFGSYPSVLVAVDAPMLGASEYLATELRDGSGFERVTTDSTQSVSLILSVTVAVEESITTDDDGNPKIDYDAAAEFRAEAPDGRLILDGTETDTSETHSESVEDVLDEVALHFLAPYRI